MKHSQPNLFRMTLGITLLFILIILGSILAFAWTTEALGLDNFAVVILAVGTILGGVLFVLFELPAMVSLAIDSDKIIVRNVLTGRKNEVFFLEIHSFKIIINATPRNINYQLVLLKDNDRISTISLSYVANLNQIIEELEKHLQNVTEDEHGILELLRNQERDLDKRKNQ